MRRYGLLLHISSLPSAWGIGDLGPAAHAFARNLADAGGSLWQFLPINPTSTFIGNSPYSSFSAFAGNPLLISPELLVEDGWLSERELDGSLDALPARSLGPDAARVDFPAVTRHRERLLEQAFSRAMGKLETDQSFIAFCREHASWLVDYARFVSIKATHGGVSWVDWPRGLRDRDPVSLAQWDEYAAEPMLKEQFVQYLFFSQWRRLRASCQERGVALLGDVPIYVTHDSADVWANPEYFHLDQATGQPVSVCGVPPDYFSETGQRWGNPVYCWDRMREDGFAWWKRRLGHILGLVDVARLDHFRGFCAYWDIPAEEDTAVRGTWIPAPARELFEALRDHFGALPFLAEDLGVITQDVRDIMREFGLPGMHVLQFAYGGPRPAGNPDIPHAHNRNAYVYTGTHDNAPTKAWFAGAPEQERDNCARYLGSYPDADQAVRLLVRQAFASVAECAIVPMQDALFLGEEGRMNIPGTARDNWTWRMTPDQAVGERLTWLRDLAEVYGRLPGEPDPPEDACACR